MSFPVTLPEETQPEQPLANWDPNDAIIEMQAACADAGWFLKQMQTNEQTRTCWWPGKTGTGKKEKTKGKDAKPFNGAADHEVRRTQTVINRRNAMRVAGIARGALDVTPLPSTGARDAGLMKQMLRYYLNGPMKTEVFTQGVRAGSYADRYRCSLMYVGWKEERGVEPVTVTVNQIGGWLKQQMMAEMQATATGMVMSPEMMDFNALVLDEGREAETIQLMLQNLPGVKARGPEGVRQAKAALVKLRGGAEEAVAHGSYVKRSSPTWEALEPFVEVFFPPTAMMEDGMESCRWIARVKWRNAQWIREQAAIHQWNPKWVAKVLKDCRGRSQMFTRNIAAMPWALNGAGVGWGVRTNSETHNHLYQIVELWDRSMTSDGLTGTYYTVMHADVKDMVAERKLREDWDGAYPFVPFSFSIDEKLLLAGDSVPEVTMTDQQSIKAQRDSRTDAAAFTTFPTWTGDPELAGMRPAPGVFLPNVRGKVPEALQLPPPDGRSIEIENAVLDASDEFFGFESKRMPAPVAMMMGQADMDWFMASYSQCVARTAKLIQQYSPPLKDAQITGTSETVTATAEQVRGGYQFLVSFNVMSLDVKWLKENLSLIKDTILTFDNRGDVNTLPILEYAFNQFDPGLASRCLPQTRETAQRQTLDAARAALTDILTGGAPEVTQGMDFGGMAQAITDEIQRSPLRQQVIVGGTQICEVLTSYLAGLVNSFKNQPGGENAQIGRTMTEDPLRQPSAAEQLLMKLKTLPEGVSLAQMMMGQMPQQQEQAPGT